MPILSTDLISDRGLPAEAGNTFSFGPFDIEREVIGLFEQFRSPLLRYAVSFGLAIQEGEEITQEVFLALFGHLELEKSRRNLRGWIFRVAHNLALRRRRSTQLGDFMLNKNVHPPDEDLLLFSDGELSAHRAARIRRHLAACWGCRARVSQTEATIVEFMRIHGRMLEPLLPPIAGPRAQLRARLEHLNRSPDHNRWQRPRFRLNILGLAPVCALALIVLLGAKVLYPIRLMRSLADLACSRPHRTAVRD
jgi:hypothetical protein